MHIEKEAEDASHYWPAPYPSVLLNMDQFVYELNAGVEQDFPLQLTGSHIPCMDISFLHVFHAGVYYDHSLKLPGGRIPCMGISFLHELSACVEQDFPL